MSVRSSLNLLPEKPKSPILCYVTDRCSLAQTTTAALTQKIAAILAAGVDWVQIREKDLPARELASVVRAAVAASGKQGIRRVIVNDRVDVAIAESADAVHLGENGLPASEVAQFVATHTAKDFFVGVSCHSLDAARSAAEAGASYIFFGPVFATPSKAEFGAPQGVARLADLCRAVAIPVMAIGGITLENAGECLAAGAKGIAAIRLFQDSPDPMATVRALRERSLASGL